MYETCQLLAKGAGLKELLRNQDVPEGVRTVMRTLMKSRGMTSSRSVRGEWGCTFWFMFFWEDPARQSRSDSTTSGKCVRRLEQQLLLWMRGGFLLRVRSY